MSEWRMCAFDLGPAAVNNMAIVFDALLLGQSAPRDATLPTSALGR
jgi:hypothetical protein